MNAEDWILAMLVGGYRPYPYSWQDGTDDAWRYLAHRLRFRRAVEEVCERHGDLLARIVD